MIRVGIDVGGTFTDAVFFDENTKTLNIKKVPSTPANQKHGVMNAIYEFGITPTEISLFLHGTTVATNAVIEKKGARVGLLTTAGFRDVMKIRRTTRGKLYDLQWDPPKELVERRYRIEIDERMDAFGTPVKKLDTDEVLEKTKRLLEQGIESIAICFLNSYINPEHELAAKRAIQREYPHLYVTASSELLRAWREFERTSTTAVSAYVGPLLERYLSSLVGALQDGGYKSDLLVMLSNGGVAPAFPVQSIAPRTLLSGPAAAAIAMKEICLKMGESSVVSIDIGGTSTDIAILHNGELLTREEQEVEFGTVVHLPIIDVITIGAGGGTMATIDKGGMLSMGPASAGADPGPVCYRKGGVTPTLTDANVLLGRLNPTHLLGGKLEIDAERSREAIRRDVARPLGMEEYEAAMGMIEIVNHNISNAIRRATLRSGLDIREFAMFASGGGGPLQAVEVAKELGMRKVIVPRFPGITAALGLLVSDVRYDYVESYIAELGKQPPEAVAERFAALKERALADLSKSNFHGDRTRMEYSLDLRYASQTHELTVPIRLEYLTEPDWMSIRMKFKQMHEITFGYSADIEEPVELVNLRLAGFGLLDKPQWVSPADGASPSKPEPVAMRRVYFKKEGFVETPVYDRESLPQQFTMQGPAIIEQIDTTVLMTPEDRLETDQDGNIIIKWGDRDD